MPILKPTRPFSFDSGLTNHWPLTADTLLAGGSPIGFGTSPMYGTIANGSGVFTSGDAPSPKIKSSMRFDNAASYIQLSGSNLPAGVAFALTHSAFHWAKYDNIVGNGGGGFRQSSVGLADSFAQGVRFGCDNASPAGAFFIEGTGGSVARITSSAAFVNNTWCHVGYTWDGVGTVQIYVNGLVVASLVGNNTSVGGNSIGSYNGSVGAITGNIADLRLYNRELSAAEVYALYAWNFTSDSEELPALNLSVQASGSGFGSPKRGVLRAYSRGLALAPRTVPRGKMQIDWTHPLANGLVGCYLPGIDGVNIANPGVCDLDVIGSALTRVNTAEGPAIQSAAANTGMYSSKSNPAIEASHGWGVYWRGIIIGVSTASNPGPPLIGYTFDAVGSSPFYRVGLNNWAINVAQVIIASGLGADGIAFSAGTTGVIQSYGGTRDDARSTINAYLNGVNVGSVGTTAQFNASNGRVAIGVDLAATSTSYSNATTIIGCIWNRELSASEIALLDADPYGFLVPVEGEMPALSQGSTIRHGLLLSGVG